MFRASPPARRPAQITLLLAALVVLGGCANSARLSADSHPNPAAARSSLGQPAADNGAAPGIQRSDLAPARDYQWNGSPKRLAEGGPQTAPAAAGTLASDPPRVVATAPAAAAPQPAAMPQPRPLERGTIEVQPGDTLFSLSRRHGVSISALMDTNKLKSLTLQPGQVLRLPAPIRSRG
jgi:LysM repeat protein